MKKSRLGRNLDMLLSGQPFEDLVQTSVLPHKEELRLLPIEWLQAGRYQPRKTFAPEALEDLAHSIRTQGIINPIVVRLTDKNNHYEIIAGERRWRAAQQANLNEVPVLIKEISDETALALSLIENIQRQDLNPLEEAEGIQRLINEFNLTHQEIGATLGRSRSTITNLLRLLSLAPQVKLLLQQERLEMGHARALLSLPESLQIQLAEKIVKNKLSVREAERFVQKGEFIPIKTASSLKINTDVQQLERKLSELLGAKVYFKQTEKGKGQLVIHYNSLEELEGILAHLN